ncbi:MAG: signal peptidase I [Bacteroides sp.]
MFARLKSLFRNRYVRFSVVTLLYLLVVLWTGSYWWLLGLIIVFDHYITRRVHWFFWRKKGVKKQKVWVEWLDAIIFAVVVASIVRLLLFEAFVIPSGSMEKTLLIGDYIFVSKVSYGPKMPNTPLAFPFAHHTLPFTDHTPSFISSVQLPYNRRLGFGKVERNDVVVFHFPEGDTVVVGYQDRSYYQMLRDLGRERIKEFQLLVRPVDRRENYIKRCVGIPGDVLEVRAGQVFVNNQAQPHFPDIQYNYEIQTNGTAFNPRVLDKFGIYEDDRLYNSLTHQYLMPLTRRMVDTLQHFPNVRSMVQYNDVDTELMGRYIFPHDGRGWTEDNFGPIKIPARGTTVVLTRENLPLYRRIIEVYEHNTLEVRPSPVLNDSSAQISDIYLINGEERSTYTFQMDYFFMMGDNRHHSLDSRFWGFVPEDHVVGKAKLIWFSTEKGKLFPFNIRWRRLFTVIR